MGCKALVGGYMKEYKINCLGMNTVQRNLVQEALFNIGYRYYNNSKNYNDGDYYFAYSCGTIYRMLGIDDRYFEQKVHAELTFNELMKLANMEEYMTFTKSDLKDGMIVVSNKSRYIKLGAYFVSSNGFNTISGFSEDLTHIVKEFTINEVLGITGDNQLGLGLKNLDKFTGLKSIWKRPDLITAQQKAILDLEVKRQELIDAAKDIAADIAKLKGV
jgi:hypothetical protein